ncbi:MAG: hypothetical protein AABZ06_13690 [Bdellovibrionota bacterium]
MSGLKSKITIFLFGIIFPVAGFSSSAGSYSDLPWSDKDKYEECGQSCLIKRANENISLEAAYIWRKIDQLMDLFKNDPKDKNIRTSLGAFCAQGELIKECLQRYVAFQKNNLRKMSVAIAENNTTTAELKSHDTVAVGVSEVMPSLKAQVTYVPQIKALQKNGRQYITKTGYSNWVENETIPPRPQLTDFPKLKQIDRDPRNPAAGKLLVIEKDDKGNTVFDKKAFEKAEVNYTKMYNDFPNLRPVVPSAVKSDADEIDKYMKQVGNSVNISTTSFASGLKNEIAFGEARKLLVDTANAELSSAGIKPAAQLLQRSIAQSTKKTQIRNTNDISLARTSAASALSSSAGDIDVYEPQADQEKKVSVSVSWSPDELQGLADLDITIP